MKLSVLVPAHNEEGHILDTISDIYQVLKKENISHEILVVNDNSKDRTLEILKKASRKIKTLRYISRKKNNAFGLAVRTGLENFKGDAVVIMMADKSDSVKNLVSYYYKLNEGYDCVFGSRFIKGGKVYDYPIIKLFFNRCVNLFIKILFGLKLNDTTNAFKGYKKKVIESILPLKSIGFELTVEIPLKCIARGYNYKIIPITWTNRKEGVSKLKISEVGAKYFKTIINCYKEKNFRK